MPNYVVNDKVQNNGDHEVHTTNCVYYPLIKNSTSLGWHSNCQSAVKEAKNHYSQSNGCATCSSECHTS